MDNFDKTEGAAAENPVVEIPDNYVEGDLEKWYKAAEELSVMKNIEMILRKRVYRHFFKNPKEGTNSHPLKDNYVLKGKRTIDRSVDEAAYKVMKDKFAELKIAEDIIRYKPELAVKEYRSLTEEQRKVFDNCLIIKDGAPALEVVLPAKFKGQ